MNKFRFTIKILAIAIFTFAFASMAQAQATRTWVSGVGDDVNPCSRTAPCKTFAGAISKTAANGEISVLDPGGFGAVTITKSLTINGTHGSGYGSILSAGASAGVIINSATAIVRLKSLDINGAGTGTDGIRINAALKVYIEDTKLDGFTNRGINDIRTTANGFLNITDSNVSGCAQSCITIIPGVGGNVTAVLDNVHSQGSGNSGYAQSGSVKGTLRNSFFTGNTQNGIFADGTGELTVENCISSHNGTGLFASAPAIVRLNGSEISNNGTSINAAGQAQVQSTGINVIVANGANNLPTGTPINQS
jgi:hypothetical protein